MDTNTVLRIVRRHGVLGEVGDLRRFSNSDSEYTYVNHLDGEQIYGGWTPDRFEVVEPQPVIGPLPAGTLLRCVEQDHWAGYLRAGTFYRIIDDDEFDAFVRVASLAGEPLTLIDGGSVPFGFHHRRFVYYPDSAPAEPTTEKRTAMSNTTATVPLTIDVARTLPIGARVIFTDGGERQGKTYILDRPGIDRDGDFHGTFEGADYGHFMSWSYFSLPADSPDAVTTTPSEGTATELQSLRVERDAFKADLTRVIDALRQEAIDREWCPEYDQFMERLGFEARCTRKFTVRRRATIEWDEEIEATDEDDAREQADGNEPSYVGDLDSDYLDLENIEIVDVEGA